MIKIEDAVINTYIIDFEMLGKNMFSVRIFIDDDCTGLDLRVFSLQTKYHQLIAIPILGVAAYVEEFYFFEALSDATNDDTAKAIQSALTAVSHMIKNGCDIANLVEHECLNGVIREDSCQSLRNNHIHKNDSVQFPPL